MFRVPGMSSAAPVLLEQTDPGDRMATAEWNGAVIAESDDTVIVEGNHYFPPESLAREYLASSEKHTVCPWKGVASYFDVVVDGQINAGAAWYYPVPNPAASQITDHVAFWRGVEIRG